MAFRIMSYVPHFVSVVNHSFTEMCETVSVVSHIRIVIGDRSTLRACKREAPDGARGQVCCVSGRFDRYAWKRHYCGSERN